MATKKTNSSINLSPNIASTLCYIPVIGWIPALVLLLIEKESSVRRNAVQSLLLTGVIVVLNLGLAVTIILAWVVPFVQIAAIVLSLVLAVKSYQGNNISLPVLGGWTDQIVKKI